ncbi:MAG: hypothetical protein J6X42_01275 [Alphaproteobacteria bacterium]|nr:hypothetical protein [Alphaproteobacteria bacterium]
MKKISFISLILLVLLYSNTTKAEGSVDEIRRILNENPEIVIEAIELVEQHDCPDTLNHHHVCGIIKNNQDKETSIRIIVKYYDEKDVQIDYAVGTILDVDPFSKAQFKTTSSDKKFDYYKIKIEQY